MTETVPHLDRALEILWETGHPRIAEALRTEVEAVTEKAERFERVLWPKVVAEQKKEQCQGFPNCTCPNSKWASPGDPHGTFGAPGMIGG